MKPKFPFALPLAMICLAFGILMTLPAVSAETGLKGTVLLGPVKPGPTKVGQSDELPLSAAFKVFAGDCQIAQFKSDKNGNFEVLLKPGEYTIVPDQSTPIPAPQSQKKTVIVPADGIAVVTLRFDSGMR